MQHELEELLHGRAPRPETTLDVGVEHPSSAEPSKGDDRDTDVPFFIWPTAAWDRLLRMEEARRARYGGAYVVVAITVVGIEQVDRLVGTATARQVFAALERTVEAVGRAADLYGQRGRWHLVGVLPGMPRSAIPAYEERFRAAFAEQAGDVTAQLVLRDAEPSAEVTLEDAAIAAIEAIEAAWSESRGATDRPGPARPSDVARALHALEDLRLEGLIDDAEYRAKRQEILARL